MPKYVIERDLPGAGKLSDQEIREVARHSCAVIDAMEQPVYWQQSYVTDDKIFCVYIAANEELIREHATKGGFPVTAISQVARVIDGATAE